MTRKTVQRVCESCRESFLSAPACRTRPLRRFCSKPCSTRGQWGDDPQRRRHVGDLAREQITAQWRDPEFRALRSREATKTITRMWDDPVLGPKLAKLVSANYVVKRYEYLDRKGRLWTLKSGDEYELGFARWLDAQELDWSYEPHVLLLSTGSRYIPDFFVREWDSYVEIKSLRWPVTKAAQARQDGHRIVILHGRLALRRFMEARQKTT